MRKKRRREEQGFNIWRSYSDMMAGVLLLFVLLMCVTMFQAQKSYDDSIKERDEKIAMQETYTQEILDQQSQLAEKEGQLQTQNAQLLDQDEQLKLQSAQLDEQKALLDQLAIKLENQEATLNAQATALDEKTALLAAQQKKIDNIIGVKAEVVEALQSEFAANNINVNIDAKTGAMTLDANVMFDVDDYELTEGGQDALSKVLPIYCKVLLKEDFKPYLAEIIIDGYTDTDGDYSYNLYLSQQRSLAVAEYLLENQYAFLNESESLDLQDFLTVNGHSMSNPILDAQGNVDKEASRRVEVKFRLKDDEMITELSDIMSSN